MAVLPRSVNRFYRPRNTIERVILPKSECCCNDLRSLSVRPIPFLGYSSRNGIVSIVLDIKFRTAALFVTEYAGVITGEEWRLSLRHRD